MTDRDASRPLRRRLLGWYLRHRRVFWLLHSLWALATGVLVLVLAHERWGLAQWVVVFLGVTWFSTLFFTRLAALLPDSPKARLGKEFVSYLTRVMYQETLFFLLPFYYSSATVPSVNLLFVALLALLAVLACLDLVFDDLLRRHPWFGLLFFALVAFASLNFLLPLLLRMRLELALPVAAACGLGAALPLVYQRGAWRRPAARWQLAAALLAVVVLAGPARAVVPPVPLRVTSLEWATRVDPESVEPATTLHERIRVDQLDAGQLAMVAEVFAPKRLPASVVLVWYRDGRELRRSRELEITPHRLGFAVWDAYRPPAPPLPPGRYAVEVETAAGRLLGRSSLDLLPATTDP